MKRLHSPRGPSPTPPSRRGWVGSCVGVCLGVLALGTPTAQAQAQAQGLIEVWQAASRHDPEFSAARAAHEAGTARRVQASALWRPNVALEGGVGRASSESSARGAAFSAPGMGASTGVGFDTSVNNGNSTRVALALRQPLFSREREVQSGQLQQSADMAELEWQQAQQALLLRSAERYFDTALAAEQLRLLTRQQSAVERALTEAQDRFRIGDRPITDTHEAAARAAGLKAQRLQAETELELKRVALAHFSGLPPAEPPLPLPLPSHDTAFAELSTLPAWLAQADQHSPALRLAQSQLALAELDARKTHAALSPTVDLVAQIGRDRLSGSGDFGPASNTAHNRAIGVQFSVPLYTGGMRSARQTEAQALVEKARAELERARQQVALQTRAAWLDLAVGASQIDALRASAVASQARLDATRVGREAGDRTTLDLLNAENDAAAAELSLTQARVRLLMSRLRLAALAGRLDETALAQVGTALRPAP